MSTNFPGTLLQTPGNLKKKRMWKGREVGTRKGWREGSKMTVASAGKKSWLLLS
jgi:hypothetical protein